MFSFNFQFFTSRLLSVYKRICRKNINLFFGGLEKVITFAAVNRKKYDTSQDKQSTYFHSHPAPRAGGEVRLRVRFPAQTHLEPFPLPRGKGSVVSGTEGI
jgi:hypothetical protein